MISDEDRREIAARLREINPYRNHSYTIPAVEYLSELAGALGYSPRNDVTMVEFQNRLADLIEPPRQCPYYDSGRHWCSIHDVPTIDRDALLALAEELEEDACWEVQTSGDTRGAWRLKDTCDRIREELGVGDD